MSACLPFTRGAVRRGQAEAMETRQHTSFRAFINRHAVLAFYILVFALQGGLYLIALLGTGYLGTGPEEPTSLQI
jgi:hypothetical protein